MTDDSTTSNGADQNMTQHTEVDKYADTLTTYNLVTVVWSIVLGAGIGLPILVLLSLALFPGRVTISTGTYWMMGIGFLLFLPLHFLRRYWLKRYEMLRRNYENK